MLGLLLACPSAAQDYCSPATDSMEIIDTAVYETALMPAEAAGGGETVVVTTGGNLDRYLYYPSTINPTIPVQTDDALITSAELTLSIYDVDQFCGSACGGVCEVDKVYFNSHYIGTLTGANGEWSTTTFFLDPDWVNGAVNGFPGSNNVLIQIDTASHSCWAVQCDWVQLILNSGEEGKARIVSIDTDHQTYGVGGTVLATIGMTTTASNQAVTLQTNIYDPAGKNIDGKSTDLVLTNGQVTDRNVPLYLTNAQTEGVYTVEAILYDAMDVQQDKQSVQVTVSSEPDYYVTAADISFESVSAVPGGFLISNTVTVRADNPDALKMFIVRCYDLDRNTGQKNTVFSVTMTMSGAEETFSFDWSVSDYDHDLIVVVDVNNNVDEADETNNEASVPLAGPTIEDVKSTYRGVFIEGLSAENTYYVTASPDAASVDFEMNGDQSTDSTRDSRGYFTQSYDMGKLDAGDDNTLIITAYNDAGIPSQSWKYTIEIYHTPEWIQKLLSLKIPIKIGPKDSNLEWDNVLVYGQEFKLIDPPVAHTVHIPSGIPIIGGEYHFGVGSAISYSLKSDLTGELSGSGEATTKIAGKEGEIGASITGGFEFLRTQLIKLKEAVLAAYGKITIPLHRWNLGSPTLTILGKEFTFVNVEMGVDAIPGIAVSLTFKDDPAGGLFAGLGWDSGEGTISTELVGHGSATVLNQLVKGSLHGEPFITLQVPEPYFKEAAVKMWTEWTCKFFWKVVNVQWPSPAWQWPESSESIGEATGLLDNIPRDYSETGQYSVFNPRNGPGMVPESYEATGPEVFEQTILENSYPYAAPDIAMDGSGAGLMVWEFDDLTKPEAQSFEVYYSVWDGNTWHAPAALTDNLLGEFSPSVAYASDGSALAAWTIFDNASIDASTDIFAVLGDAEIAYAAWDGFSWTGPVILTDNGWFDSSVSLSGGPGANITAVWLQDQDNDIWSTMNQTIMSATWNGTAWIDMAAVAADVPVTEMPALVETDDGLVIVWSQDVDGDSSTTADVELFYSAAAALAWSAPVQLTTNAYCDANPVFALNQSGVAHLAWIERQDENDHVRLAAWDGGFGPAEPVTESPSIYEMELAFDGDDNAVVVWQGISPSIQDIFYTVRDNSNQLWNGAMQLTNDNSAEWQLSMAMDTADQFMVAYVKDNVTIVDGEAVYGESDLDYLVHTIMLDLAVTDDDISCDTLSPASGDTVTVSAVIANVGDLAASSVDVAFIDSYSGIQIDTIQTIAYLPAGQNDTVSVAWTLPLDENAHAVVVLVDPSDVLPETFESNNEAVLPLVSPDLGFIDDIAYSYYPGYVWVNTTVANFGPAAAEDISLRIYEGEPGGIIFAACEFPAIALGANDTVAVHWPTADLEAGYYLFSAVIDEDDEVPELDETNNTAATTLLLAPDFEVTSNDIEVSGSSAGVMTMSAEVRNIGCTGAENVNITFYDGNPDMGGSVIENVTAAGIPAAESVYKEFLWDASAGSHEIYVVVDPQDEFTEYDQGNNVAILQIVIAPGADLHISTQDITVVKSPAGNIVLMVTVHNDGDSEISYATLACYEGYPSVSGTNPYQTEAQNLIGTGVVSEIPAKGSVVAEVITDWRAELNQPYVLFAEADPGNDLRETDETNNIAGVPYGEYDVLLDGGSEPVYTYPAPSAIPLSPGGTVPYRTILSSDHGLVELQLPAGVVVQNSDGAPHNGVINITPVDAGTLPPFGEGMIFECVGIAVLCEPAGLTFSSPVDLVFSIPDEIWDTLDPETLSVQCFNPSTGSWESVPCTVDIVNHQVIAHVSHFSNLAIVRPGIAGAVEPVPETVTGTIPAAEETTAIVSDTAIPAATTQKSPFLSLPLVIAALAGSALIIARRKNN